MLNKKKILPLIILLLGIIVSVKILSLNNTKKTESLANDLNANNPNVNLSYDSKDDGSILEISKNNKNTDNIIENTDNLTEDLINSYTLNLLENANEENNDISEEKATDIFQNNIPQTVDYPKFKEVDIKIINDISDKKQITYIEKLDAVLWDNFKNLKNENMETALKQFFEEDNSKVLESFINVIPQYLDDLLEIEVPKNWVDFHIQTLNLWQKKITTYKAIYNQEEDPLKSYLMIQKLPILVQESKDLRLIIIQQYKELTSNL